VRGCFVYCYLRTHSNRPYYVGLGTRADRMTARHSCKVPADRTRIRILRQGLTREQADHWEAFYIARFGRKVDGGLLLNTREGGDGGAHDAETTARIAAKVRERHLEGAFVHLNGRDSIERRRRQRAVNKAVEFGIPVDAYLRMSTYQRDRAKAWLKANPGETFADWQAAPRDRTAYKQRSEEAAAARNGLKVEDWQALSSGQRRALSAWMRLSSGRNPHDWIAGMRGKPGPKVRAS
jgi:hypothetical protein